MEVNLKSNGWYNRLQAWTLGDAKPDLFSLCPFFWLTIFCMIVSPITLFTKGIVIVVKTIDRQMESRLDKWINSLSANEAVNLYNGDYKRPFGTRKIGRWDAFEKWKIYMESTGLSKEEVDVKFQFAFNAWNKKSEARQALWKIERIKNDEILEQKYIKDAARTKRRKNAWIPIVKWTQLFVNLAVTLAIMSVTALLINIIIANFSWTATLDGLIVFGIAAGIILLLFLLIYLIVMYVNWCRDNDRTPLFLKALLYVGTQIGKFLTWSKSGIGKGFANIFGLFWTYFKARKNYYCPAINWDVDEKSK